VDVWDTDRVQEGGQGVGEGLMTHAATQVEYMTARMGIVCSRNGSRKGSLRENNKKDSAAAIV
jgi:hypothetical protein